MESLTNALQTCERGIEMSLITKFIPPKFPVDLTALTPQSKVLVKDILRRCAAAIGSGLAKRVVQAVAPHSLMPIGT